MKRHIPLAASLLALAVMSGCGRQRVEQTTNPWRSSRALVIPHAGGDGMFPENTLLAYEQTMAMGADVVDVDVRLSLDNVPVVIHDADTFRTTGTHGEVARLTAGQLNELDAGYAFTRNGEHPYRGKGLGVPTLEAVIERFPDALLSIDLKDERLAMVEPVCEVLRRQGKTANVFVGSNGDDVILSFRKRCPAIATSAVMPDVYEMRDARANNDQTFQPKAFVDQPPFRVGKQTIVSTEGIAYAHDRGVAMLTWVINDEKDMKELMAMGIDGIYTSYPDRMLRLQGRLRSAPE